MTETLAAILTAFDGALNPTPYAGGLYLDHIPSNATPATRYCVINQIPGKPMSRAFGNKLQENPVIQFTAYAPAAVTALTDAETIATTFDAFYRSASLTLSSGRWLSCLRVREPLITYVGQDQNADDLSRAVVRYELSIQKN